MTYTGLSSEEYVAKVREENKVLFELLQEIIDTCNPDEMEEGIWHDMTRHADPYAARPIEYKEEEDDD